MTNFTSPAIEARDLRKQFAGGAAVEDVSFPVSSGRVVGLLGPNGAGKTTTIRMLLGLVAPDSGTALIHGNPYAELTDPLSVVGAVLDAGGLHPGRSGRQHLRVAAAQARVGAGRVDKVLAEVDLTAAADRPISGYSLGMRQRIAIATALLGAPRILVLDEPANGLDPAGMRWLRQRIRAFADGGGAVLLSSHVLSDVSQIADDIVIMQAGRVVADLPLADALDANDGDLERFYLELTGAGSAVR
ncbi:ABC-2 type transport system ATP-binding protein [Glaciihabitans tibetensis]|uniref:ABC-2 type transport system ATP-binding protein n=1 Tax=Glaciihabitans tibetensis TaxID=1266600 RepID=A0A2T0V372_9MICO|nr:ATP-binding cassette domain-containing protein [Glaciihabitans tibetensis]PRY64636.1 ABC-2 type transport system ATP-binding protein [Glaciihabitans tibetensis]